MRLIRISVLFLVTITGIACQSQRPEVEESKKLHVAAILSISGRYSAIDVPTRDALQLWVENYKKGGGQLEFHVEDAGSDPIRAVERFETLWSHTPAPQILLLSTSSIAMAVTPHLRTKDVLVVANAGHPDLIQSSNAYTFSTFPNLHNECGLFTARLKQLNASTVFIVHASDVYHQADAALLKSMMQGKVIGEEQYQEGSTDFSQVTSRIMKVKPDAVVLFGFGISYPAFQAELARRGFGGSLLVDTDYLYNELSQYPRELLPQTSFVGPANLGELSAFQRQFKERYGAAMPYFASFIVDGLTLATEAAMKSEKRGPREMTQYLVTVKDRELLSGPVTIQADHHFSYRLALYQPTTAGNSKLNLGS